jgi:exonuclease VII large subunit
MDPQLEDAVGRITREVVVQVNAQLVAVVTATERRLSEQAQTNLDGLSAAFAATERRLSEQVQTNLDAAERRLSEQARVNLDTVTTALTAAEQRLADQAQVNVEAVKSEARMAADGYAGTLESIERRLDRIEGALDSKFTHYDAVLKDHNDRIRTLEQ